MNRILQNGGKGISEIEGKAARVAASEAGAERVSIEERDFRDYKIKVAGATEVKTGTDRVSTDFVNSVHSV
jgi:hypothetical protein